jgi:membrane protease YdiL (CAAX protease family)
VGDRGRLFLYGAAMLHLAPGQHWIDLVLVAYAVAVMPVLSVINGRRLSANPDGSLVPRYWRTMIRGWLAVALVAAAWISLHRDFAALGLDAPIGPYGRYGLLAVAVAAIGLGVVLTNIRRVIKPARFPELRAQMRELKILPRTNSELLVFLGVAVTAGVWEELMYRGFLIWFIAPYAGVIAAVFLSSLIFGLGHGYQGAKGIVRTFVLGAVFAIAYMLTHSLWWVMAAHALVDLWGGTLGWRVLRMPEAQPAQA